MAATFRPPRSARVLRSVAHSPALRRVEGAFVGFNVAEYGSWIAILVFAYRLGGTAATGIVGAVQLVPAALFAPMAASLGDRYPRGQVLNAGYLAQGGTMALTGVLLVARAPAVPIILCATLAATAITLTRPVQGALLPSLARIPEELVAANVVAGWIEGVGILAGPLLTGILLVVSGPGTVFLVMAGVLLLSALLTARLACQPSPAAPSSELEVAITPSTLLGGFSVLRRASRPRLVISLLAAHFLLVGALDVLLVVLAFRLLHLGSSGVGFLNAAFGAGGLIGAMGTVTLIGRRRLSIALLWGTAAWGVGLVLIGLAANRLTAPALIVLIGAGRPLIDVTGRSLLQRVVADNVLSRVFGVLEGLSMAAQGAGLACVPLLFGVLHDRATFVALGLFLPVLTLLAWRSLAAIDAAPIPAAQVALLRSLPLFAPLSPPVLARLAGNLIPVGVDAGTDVVRQGQAGDRFYLVVEGEMRVTIDGRPVGSIYHGGFFGEIALLRDIPRTATVTACTPARLYALERGDFLEAVTGHPRSALSAERLVRAQLGEQPPVSTPR